MMFFMETSGFRSENASVWAYFYGSEWKFQTPKVKGGETQSRVIRGVENRVGARIFCGCSLYAEVKKIFRALMIVFCMKFLAKMQTLNV